MNTLHIRQAGIREAFPEGCGSTKMRLHAKIVPLQHSQYATAILSKHIELNNRDTHADSM